MSLPAKPLSFLPLILHKYTPSALILYRTIKVPDQTHKHLSNSIMKTPTSKTQQARKRSGTVSERTDPIYFIARSDTNTHTAASENRCRLDFHRSLSPHHPDAVTTSLLRQEMLLSLFTNCLEEKERG